MMVRLIVITTLLTLSYTCSVQADKVYIRDTLYVQLRGGQSTEHRILHKGLKSGTELERLDSNDETKYTQVRTDDGLEGWVPTQYVSEQPIASQLLEGVNGQLESLETEHQQSLLRLREAKDLNDAMSSETEAVSEINAQLTADLQKITELAANVIAIDDENKQLAEDREALLSEMRDLNELNDGLSDTRAQEWFLRGAGTILIGLLFGFWIARRIYNRRNASGWV